MARIRCHNGATTGGSRRSAGALLASTVPALADPVDYLALAMVDRVRLGAIVTDLPMTATLHAVLNCLAQSA